MEIVDKRSNLFELDEIYKYKDLIERADRDVIKEIIYNGDKQSIGFYNEFLKLVAQEIDHQLNKTEFANLKNKLIADMKAYLQISN